MSWKPSHPAKAQVGQNMPNDRDPYVHKDNPFHKRMADVRYQMGANLNEAEALNLVKTGGAKNPFVASIPTVEQRQLTDEEIDQKAFFDVYTPTYNFRYLLRSMHRELIRARRYKRALSIAVVIIDGLHNIMTQYGHFALEQCIMAGAETLIKACRADVDMVGRYGEDRFILLLPETPGTGAAVLCERIRKDFLKLDIQHQWYKIPLTCSIGIAYHPGHGGGIEELIAQADLAAEVVQEHGGNGIAYAPESPDPEVGASETYG